MRKMTLKLIKKDTDPTYLQINIAYGKKFMAFVCHTDNIKSDNNRQIELFDLCKEFFGNEKGERAYFNLIYMINDSAIL